MLYLFNQQNEHQKALIFLTLHLLPWVCVISQRSNQQLAQRTERLAADCRESLRDKTSEGALSVTAEVVIGTAMMLSLGDTSLRVRRHDIYLFKLWVSLSRDDINPSFLFVLMSPDMGESLKVPNNLSPFSVKSGLCDKFNCEYTEN